MHILPFHVKVKIPKYIFCKTLTLCGKQHVMVSLLLLQKNIRLCVSYELLNKSFLHNNSIVKNTLHQSELHLHYYLSKERDKDIQNAEVHTILYTS